MGSLVRWLYRLARLGRDAEVLASGDPAKVTRRLVNKAIGRILGPRVRWRPRRKG
jgi:hypothetical protein